MNNFPSFGGSGFGGPGQPNLPSHKQGGSETVGPNDPIFHQPVGHPSHNNNATNLPSGAHPPGAHYDPLTPFDTKTAGPDKDEAGPPGSGPIV